MISDPDCFLLRSVLSFIWTKWKLNEKQTAQPAGVVRLLLNTYNESVKLNAVSVISLIPLEVRWTWLKNVASESVETEL